MPLPAPLEQRPTLECHWWNSSLHPWFRYQGRERHLRLVEGEHLAQAMRQRSSVCPSSRWSVIRMYIHLSSKPGNSFFHLSNRAKCCSGALVAPRVISSLRPKQLAARRHRAGLAGGGSRGAVLGLRMPFVTLHVRCMCILLSLRRRNGIHNQPAPRSGLQTRSSRRPFKCHRNCRSEGRQLALHCIPLFRAVSPPKVGLCTTPRAVAALKLQFSRLRKNSPPLAPIVPARHSDPATSSERSEGSGNRRLIERK